MKHFGELLRSYIKKSGYSNYALAQKAGVNRTTLQKVLSGERSPSPELLHKLLRFLKLTPEEAGIFFSKIEELQTGETAYARHQLIRQLLESVSSGLDCAAYTAAGSGSRGQNGPLPGIQDQLTYGSRAVIRLLNELVLQECTQPSPSMLACVTGRLPLPAQVLRHSRHCCPQVIRLRVKQLTGILKEEKHSDFPTANLETLSNLLPVAATADFSYEISYFYEENVLTDVTRTAFPYYIVFSQVLVLLSADCGTALCCNSGSVIDHFQNLFEAAWSDALPLITKRTLAPDILSPMSHMAENDPAMYVLEYQPRLPAYFTEELVRDMTGPDLPELEHRVQALVYRARRLRDMTNLTSLFNKTGLLDFVKTGYLADFPPEYVRPLSLEARKYLLEELYGEIVLDRQRHRMVNPLLFPAAGNLTCCLYEDKGMDFSGFSDGNKICGCIHLEEQSLLEAFSDFFQFMVASPLVYTREETLDYIRQCIGYLG